MNLLFLFFALSPHTSSVDLLFLPPYQDRVSVGILEQVVLPVTGISPAVPIASSLLSGRQSVMKIHSSLRAWLSSGT